MVASVQDHAINNMRCSFLQRKFVRDKPTLSSARGKLYSNFLTWMRAQYGWEPTATECSHFIDEDERVCWNSSHPAVCDPESIRILWIHIKLSVHLPSWMVVNLYLITASRLHKKQGCLKGDCQLLSPDWLNFL